MTALTIADAGRALRPGTLTAAGLPRQVSDRLPRLRPASCCYRAVVPAGYWPRGPQGQ
jgi:hypothetical protein